MFILAEINSPPAVVVMEMAVRFASIAHEGLDRARIFHERLTALAVGFSHGASRPRGAASDLSVFRDPLADSAQQALAAMREARMQIQPADAHAPWILAHRVFGWESGLQSARDRVSAWPRRQETREDSAGPRPHSTRRDSVSASRRARRFPARPTLQESTRRSCRIAHGCSRRSSV